MLLYGGIDLHASSNHIGLIDGDRRRVMRRKLANDPELILNVLGPYEADLAGIVVESTYNWYWLVDLLMDEGYIPNPER